MNKLGLFSLALAVTVAAVILLNDPRSSVSFAALLSLDTTVEEAPDENCRCDHESADEESELVFRESRAAAHINTVESLGEPVNLPGAYEYFDEEDISAEAAARFRAISVLPFNPLETHCDSDWVTEGQSFELLYGEKCVSTRKYPPTLNYALPLKELERKAEFEKDALAAAVASERLEQMDKPRFLGLAIYASLLLELTLEGYTPPKSALID